MTNLQQRLLSALVMLVLLGGSIIWLPFFWLVVLISMLAAIVIIEAGFMFNINIISLILISLGSMALIIWGQLNWWLVGLVIVYMCVYVVMGKFIADFIDKTRGFYWLDCCVMSIVAIVFGQVVTMLAKQSITLLLVAMSIVWVTDSMAYFGGKALGKTRCFAPISPNKTLEGCIVGSVCAALSFVGLNYYLNLGVSYSFLVGLLVALLAVIGDLFASLLKRVYQVKDSGNWIPGHGGLLDRVDGLLLALPGFVVLTRIIL